ncbi:HMG-Y-related protein A [Quillaja saponaria]|uniref:HMG-Y-related protein A n=1 Tax=Quillaja saponaria TaxID=32244 RepID=A0AAD7M5D4_QUISA|nr:HMG-Y-related protein A [Quillaja saponaria]
MDSIPIRTANDTAAVPATPVFPAVNAVEVDNHIAHAANATPNATPTVDHPPYAEMICTAIEALKEKNGSSRRAIAKYIEQVYPGLPPTHSALLTHHLKRLKNNGLLVMVKKSYKLPKSDPLPSGSQRGRGRPPKPKIQTQPQSESIINAHKNPDEVFAALGLVDEPTVSQKRSPGRPRKTGVVEVEATGHAAPAPAVRKTGRGRKPVPKIGTGIPWLPKRPGRPPKPKSVSTISNSLKRRPGRPPKTQLAVIPFIPPSHSVPTSISSIPASPIVSNSPAPGAPVVPTPKSRGRPKKNATPAVGPEVGVDSSRKHQGRAAAGVRVPKSPTGRPVGRPKKKAQSTTASATDSQLVIQDLMWKLGYFQSKVKDVVGVLKPQLTNESPITAFTAIHELELLATMDLNAPSRDGMQQQHPFPEPDPEPQPQTQPQLHHPQQNLSQPYTQP